VRRSLRLLAIAVALLAVVVVALLVTIQFRWKRTFDAPYPDIRASRDPSVLARGEYIVYGAAHCAACHTPNSESARVATGERLPLRGGHEWVLPVGRIYSANLTPDPETGIGRLGDAALARSLRYGVRPDGRAALPFMEFHDLSDEDLTAIISFLRIQPAVRHAVPDHRLNVVGKAALSFFITPAGPASTPARESPVLAPTIERGRYLAAGLAGCVGCHTQRNKRNGSYTGPRFAGGEWMPAEDGSGVVFVTPNLTPHEKTGHVAHWTEDAFVTRFRLGRIAPGSPMPWSDYQNLNEDDVRAIYRYLRSLQPVERDNGPIVRMASR
jgi:mono/diheme cytochrome c family protein